MLREDRIAKIAEIEKGDSKTTKKLTYKTDRAKPYGVYEVPLNAIIFNSLNGRIGSFRNAYEKQYGRGTLDAENPDHEQIIIDTIWNQRKTDNENTKRSIEQEGQIEPGVITRDGIIIDGNRRAMCLKKIDPNGYFLAAILPDYLAEEQTAIRRLETQLQMGRDAIVDYDTTAKYLRAKEFRDEDGEDLETIAKHFRELKPNGKGDASIIQQWLDILEQMEKFQDRQGYSGYYDNLADQKMEGHFVDLTKYSQTYKNKKGAKALTWKPDNSDISDLEECYSNYARAGFPVADVRVLGNTADSSKTGIFNYSDIWNKFKDKYEKIIDEYYEPTFEKMLEENDHETSVRELMQKRDANFQEGVAKKLKELLSDVTRERDNLKKQDEPYKLLEAAMDTLERIDKKNARYESTELEAGLMLRRIKEIVEQLEKNLQSNE